MIRAEGDLWRTIANGRRTYRLRELDIPFDNALLDSVLSDARQRANAMQRSITIDAFYEGQWFQMDIVYPTSWSG
jgi:hypothetical protein